MACDPQALLSAAQCYLSALDRATLDAVELVLLCAIRDGTPVACDPSSLLAQANCLLNVIPQGAFSAAKLGVLCSLVSGSGSGSGGGGGGGGTALTQVFSGNYGGAAPPFTPTATNAVAFDTSNGTQWNFYLAAWH